MAPAVGSHTSNSIASKDLLNLHVISLSAVQQVKRKATDKKIIAIAALQFIFVVATEKAIVSETAKDQVETFISE